MWKCISILLLVILSALATGIPQAIHQHQHDLEDAQEDAQIARAAATHSPDNTPQPAAPHNHDDCPTCAQFHAPLFAASHTTWLIDTGTWVRYVSMLAPSQQSQTSPDRISCRGPPAISC